MSATIDLKVTGVRGGQPTWNPNKGRIVVFGDIGSFVSFDAFEGSGGSYKRREKVFVEVSLNERETTYCFNGIEGLAKVLKKGFLFDELKDALVVLQTAIEYAKKEYHATYVITTQDEELINSTLKKLEELKKLKFIIYIRKKQKKMMLFLMR